MSERFASLDPSDPIDGTLLLHLDGNVLYYMLPDVNRQAQLVKGLQTEAADPALTTELIRDHELFIAVVAHSLRRPKDDSFEMMDIGRSAVVAAALTFPADSTEQFSDFVTAQIFETFAASKNIKKARTAPPVRSLEGVLAYMVSLDDHDSMAVEQLAAWDEAERKKAIEIHNQAVADRRLARLEAKHRAKKKELTPFQSQVAALLYLPDRAIAEQLCEATGCMVDKDDVAAAIKGMKRRAGIRKQSKTALALDFYHDEGLAYAIPLPDQSLQQLLDPLQLEIGTMLELPNDKIATALGGKIRPRWISDQVKFIMQALGANTRTQAALMIAMLRNRDQAVTQDSNQ